MMNPVAENLNPGMVSRGSEVKIHQCVAMSEYEISHRRIDRSNVIAGEGDKRLRGLAFEEFHLRIRRSRMAAPAKRERDSPSRMYAGIEFLQKAATEHGPQKTETARELPHPVAMREEEAAPEYIAYLVTVDYLYPDFIAEIVEEPDVVVADKPCDLHSAVGQSGQGAEETHIAARHHSAVFKPIVKNVAQQKQFAAIVGNRVKETHHSGLMPAPVGYGPGAEMKVRDEICGLLP